MGKITNSLVVVVLNEEGSISILLDSLLIQTKKPDEVIFIDGGSRDNTIKIIKNHEVFKKFNIHVFKKIGNIAVGRNEGIKRSSGAVIAFTDAGCILDRDWFLNITFQFQNKSTKVVAGYYESRAQSVFQECLAPYVLVMPDRVNPKKFLPATRSVAIRREVFGKVGVFREDLNHAEDHEFGKRLQASNIDIKFQKNAIVSWIPRDNIISAFKMFYNYAGGDINAGILRFKVFFIFTRYILFICLLLLSNIFVSNYFLYLTYIIVFLYIYWSIAKNYKYVRKAGAFFYLPLIQIISDIAVMTGSISGIINITSIKIWGIQNKH